MHIQHMRFVFIMYACTMYMKIRIFASTVLPIINLFYSGT